MMKNNDGDSAIRYEPLAGDQRSIVMHCVGSRKANGHGSATDKYSWENSLFTTTASKHWKHISLAAVMVVSVVLVSVAIYKIDRLHQTILSSVPDQKLEHSDMVPTIPDVMWQTASKTMRGSNKTLSQDDVATDIIPISVQTSVSSNNLQLKMYVKSVTAPQARCHTFGGMSSARVFGVTIEPLTSLESENMKHFRISSTLPLPVNDKTYGFFGRDTVGCYLLGKNLGVAFAVNASVPKTEEEYSFSLSSSNVFQNVPVKIHLTEDHNQSFVLHAENTSAIHPLHIAFIWVDKNGTIRHTNMQSDVFVTKDGSDILVKFQKSSPVSSGGIMIIHYGMQESLPYFMDHLSYTKIAAVIPVDWSDPFPEGNVYVGVTDQWTSAELYNGKIYVETNKSSVIECTAYGNPILSLQMFKLNPRKSIRAFRYNHKYAQSVVFNADDRDGFEGQYVCEATSTSGKVQRLFSLKRLVPLKMNDKNSRLRYNGTDKVVISCEASGLPPPTIEFEYNWRYGGQMLTNVNMTVDSSRNLVQSVLTIEPRDPNIWRVFCIAKQRFLSKVTSFQIRSQPDYYSLPHDPIFEHEYY